MTGDVNIADRLGRMNEAWGQAEVSTGGGMPPDGTYQALIHRFDFKDSDYSGLQLETELEISSGDHKGRPVTCWHDLEDPEKLSWVKGHLSAMGLDVDTVSVQDLYTDTGYLEGLLDVPVEIRIKTRTKQVEGETKSYTNVYVNKRLGPPVQRHQQSDLPVADTAERVPAGASASSNADDDIPF